MFIIIILLKKGFYEVKIYKRKIKYFCYANIKTIIEQKQVKKNELSK